MSQRAKNILLSKTAINDPNNMGNLISQTKEEVTSNPIVNTQPVPLVKDNNNPIQTSQEIQPPIMSSPFNNYGGFYGGMFPYNNMMMNPGFNDGNNTFFNKLFMTFERANYQMYHLCEMIKMIQNQLPTMKYFWSLIKRFYRYALVKYKQIIDALVSYIKYLRSSLSYSNQNFDTEMLHKQIKTINFLIKITFFTCIIGYITKLT